ncbi:hypothetical protein KUTeg_004559 [Tegillarca granosa]|uniref:Uncharacterized protein n=1 Tax=Tegillarca granosa TaxID=220873 RepID=A0ABQ9FUU0_TEGGR|nr:hypothetical protein KUTeg_004559 [Tegillarca granosa]
MTQYLNDQYSVYSKIVFPRTSQSDAIEVKMDYSLLAITDFDEVAGTIEMAGILTITWTDQLVISAYNPATHGTITNYLIPQDNVWKPGIAVFNTVKSVTSMGDSSYKIRITVADGTMEWKPAIVTKTGCIVDAAFFPFDTQTCEVQFTPWGYKSTEVYLSYNQSTIATENYDESAEWTLKSTSASTEVINGISYLKYELTLVRKPVYFLLNMVLPVLVLSLLNTVVFLLPAASGERIGFTLTAFLTFAVFLSLVSENLPRTSSPLSLLCYFLMCMVLVSAGTAIITVFTLRIYFKDDEELIPKPLAAFIACANCHFCTMEDDDELDEDMIKYYEEHPDEKAAYEAEKEAEIEADPLRSRWYVTWRLISDTFDIFFFIAAIGINAAVDIQLKLYAITNFDEVAGTLEIVGEVIVKWKDPFLVKNYDVGTHVAMEVYLPQDDIWKPSVTVFNSVSALKTVGDDDYEVLVSLITGEVIWQPALLTQTTCSVNAAFYPFDTQYCKITFTNWGYKTSEITFNPSDTTVDVNSFQDNVEWDLTTSKVTTYNTSGKSFVDFELTLVRRPIFFLVNMLIPIILLGILNALVFVLPADSGERIGFAVNVFLTFAVYLTILAENLPKTSSPLSQLSYYVTVMLSVSSLTTLMTILGLRIYDKDYETWVPLYLAYINDVLTCSLSFSIIALTKFDEVRGTLEVVGYLDVTWENELWTWTTGTHPFTEILLPQNDVWKPTIVLANSVESLEELGDSSYNIRAFNNGTMQWKLGIVATTGCFVDIVFNSSQTEINKDQAFEENVEWVFSSSSVSSTSISGQSYVKFTINIQRRPGYFVVVMVTPIIILAVLNMMIFILPADSGERVGFAITAFLTYAMFLTMVSDSLPKASSPMSLLSYFLTLMLVMSSLTTIITIINLRVYHQNEDLPVPAWLRELCALLTLRRCRDRCCKANEVSPEDEEENDEEKKPPTPEPPKVPKFKRRRARVPRVQKEEEKEEEELIEEEEEEENENSDEEDEKPEEEEPGELDDIDWKYVGGTMDGFFFVSSLIGTLLISGFFLMPLALEASDDLFIFLRECQVSLNLKNS